MAWNAVGVERFRSYREYQEMSENLTAVQSRCTELLLEARQMRLMLVEKDVVIQKLQAALALSGAPVATVPPPTMEVEDVSLSRMESALKEMREVAARLNEEHDDDLPIPSGRSPSVASQPPRPSSGPKKR